MFDLKQLKKYAQKAQEKKADSVALDGTQNETVAKTTAVAKPEMQLDSAQEVANKIAVFQEQQIAAEAMALVDEWLNTEDSSLDEGEGMGDRLYSLMIGLADENKDGDISDDEAEVINIGLNAVADYFVFKGISEENTTALLTDFDNELANNVREMLLGAIPDGDEELYAEMDKIMFSPEENESVFDSATDSAMLDSVAEKEGIILDAAYRKVFAIRHGKKLRINKRVSGKVRLSAKQRQAIRKAQRKAFTGAAKMKRLRSFRLRKKFGI